MELNKYNCIHWLGYSSFTFNTESYVILTNSMLVLQNENHFKKVLFWGVIQCLDADYYIAFGYKTDAIVGRTFFYSDDRKTWKLLPVPQHEHLMLAELCKKPFQGDPGLIIEIVDDAPLENLLPHENSSKIENANLEGEDKNKPDTILNNKKPEEVKTQAVTDIITSGELKEEDRLAAIIHIITEETAIVPRGGIFKQTDGVNVHSRAFEGLTLDDADELCSFQHYRLPQQDWNTNLLSRVDYNYALDFLDTIDKDMPSDCWTAQLVEAGRTIILRSLHWPGFMFFHHLQTPDHGFVYVGNGQRNLDIPFMTQISDPVQTIMEPSLSSLQTLSRLSNINGDSLKGLSNKEEEIEQESLFPEQEIAPLAEPSDIEGEIITSA